MSGMPHYSSRIFSLVCLFNCLSCDIFAVATSSSSSMGSSSTMGSSSMGTSSSLGSSNQSSGTLEKMAPLERAKPGVQPKVVPLPAPVAPPAPIVQNANYFYPGIIVNRNGEWEGGDDLLNLTSNIGFYLSIIKPDNDPLVIPENQLKLAAESTLQKARITTKILVPPGQAPLPFFQIQILIYPIAKEGYVACCEGRLFESVNLQRIGLDNKNMAYQAITWQKSTLIISPNSKINEQIQQHVEDISKAFAERFQSFDNYSKQTSIPIG